MRKKHIQTLACALFHDGIEVNKLSDVARAELRKAVKILLAEFGPKPEPGAE